MAKRQKAEATLGPVPVRSAGLKRSASLRVPRVGSKESEGPGKHTRGVSGDRNIRLRSGSNTSNASDTNDQRKHTRGLSADRNMKRRSGLNASNLSESAGQRKHARGLSGDRNRQRQDSSSSNTSESEKYKAGGMTIPTTPTVLKYGFVTFFRIYYWRFARRRMLHVCRCRATCITKNVL